MLVGFQLLPVILQCESVVLFLEEAQLLLHLLLLFDQQLALLVLVLQLLVVLLDHLVDFALLLGSVLLEPFVETFEVKLILLTLSFGSTWLFLHKLLYAQLLNVFGCLLFGHLLSHFHNHCWVV